MEKEKKYRIFRIDDRDIKVEIEDLETICFKNLRPRNMSYEDFRIIRKILGKEVKKYLKGRLVHISKVSDSAWKDMTKDMENKPIQKGKTYVRKEK